MLGEGPRNVFEEPRTIPRVDRDLDAEALRRAAVPAHRREALGVAAQRPDVGAVLPMDRDPLAQRDVADDLVARNRRAALREADEHVLDAFDVDPELGAPDCLRRARRLERDGVLFRDLRRLQPLDDLVDDLIRRELSGAEREVEVLRLLEARLSDHLGEHGGAGDLPVRQLLLLQRLLEGLAALLLGVLARLAGEPLPDLVPRARGLRERQPVARRAAPALRRQDLDEVAALQRVVERHDPAVDACADGLVADVRVHRVGEVDRRRPRREHLDFALRRVDVDLVDEEVAAHRLLVLARVGLVVPVHGAGAPRRASRSSGFRPLPPRL